MNPPCFATTILPLNNTSSSYIGNSAALFEQYLETVDAPYKHLILFEQSAHNLPFEEKKFNKVLIEEVVYIESVDLFLLVF